MKMKLRKSFLTVLLLLALVLTSITTLFAVGAAATLKVTTQPVSVTAKEGATAKVTLKATGDGLTYKWYYKDKGDKKFALTKSFTGTSYSVKMSKARHERQIYCVINDKYGSSVKTKTATLYMGTPLKLKKQPVSVVAPKGTTAKVSLKAAGDGLTYKWYYKNSGDKKFTRTKSFTGNSYSVEMNSTRNKRQIYCVIEDKYGFSVKTKAVTLYMGNPLTLTRQPFSATAAKGTTAKVTVPVTGDGLTYKWYFKEKGEKKFTLTKSFTGKTYSVKMNADRNGRQVYCVVKDKYGFSVKTEPATLTMGKTLAITTQPKSVSATEKTEAKVTLKASGSGLTYKWYYKNKGDTKFTRTSTFKGTSYKAEMTAGRDGRQIYCIVTDKYGSSVQTNTVTLTTNHVYGSAVVTKKATCTKAGEKVYTCTICSHKKVKSVAMLGHNLGDWTMHREPTPVLAGVERKHCSRCSYYQDRDVKKVKAVHYITTHIDEDETAKIGVGSNGRYDLAKPTKAGQIFKGWADAQGNPFSSSGHVSQSMDVYAIWEVEATTSLSSLIKRVEAGYEKIRIAANITVTQPIFITHNTTIFADGDYSLKRDPKYNGDIFVVGSDKNGVSALLHNRKAVLNLGGGNGTLTIDGNKAATTVDVLGSAVFISDSATLNLYNGARLTNNKKVGNSRMDQYAALSGDTARVRAGGAAIQNLNATVHMYGGLIDNNEVALDYTIETDATGAQVSVERAGCGGGVYNKGNFYLHGGTIAQNKALRGGGVYNDRIAYLYAGVIEDNLSNSYGGAVSSSSSSNADLFIGSEGNGDAMIIRNNHSLRAGGAVYSSTNSPIVVLGNTVFENNVTESSGGAIYTAGPLTVQNTQFLGNSCAYSGGAIYHHYSNPEVNRRLMELTGSTFQGNKGGLGGAVILSAAEAAKETGTYAAITDCEFLNNEAIVTDTNPGNGGAIYITRKCDAVIKECTFRQNSAKNNAGGVAIHSGAKVQLSDSTFTENTAIFGGGMYTSSESNVKLTNVAFTGNSATLNASNAGGNGGGIYLNEATLTLNNVDFTENTAATNAGAIYQGYSTLNLDATCDMIGNHADGHGGAIYMTYKTVNNEKIGSRLFANGTLFKENTAQAGGAISIRSACEATLTNAVLEGNSVSGTGNDASGGGAIYVGFGGVNLKNVAANGNISAGHGGVINAVGATVTVEGGNYQGNNAPSGGAFNAISNSTLTFKDATLAENASTNPNTETNNTVGGGAVNINTGKLTVNNSTLSGNSAGYYGGAVLASKATVNIGEDTLVENSQGGTGGALYFRNGSTVLLKDITLTGNLGRNNGMIYANAGSITLDHVTATGNQGGSGGVLFASGGSTQITVQNCDFSENTANNGGALYFSGATATVTDTSFSKNTAKLGGAVYLEKGTLNTTKTTFTQNSAVLNSSNAAGNGGAVGMAGGTLNTTDTVTFEQNTAAGHGGAVYVSYYSKQDEPRENGALNANGTLFQGNTALAGGAVSIRTGCEATLENLALTQNTVTGYAGENDGDGDGGGAIYVGFGALTLNNVTATENTASGFGGAVDAVGATVNVSGGSYSKNAAEVGGAFHAINNSTLTVSDATFTENESTFVNTEENNTMGGGAIKTVDSTLNLNKVIFDGNKTDFYASAVMVYGGNATLNETTVQNGEGTTGAALFFAGTTATIDKSTITENTARRNGVLYATSSTLTVTDSTITKNNSVNGTLYTSAASSNITFENCTLTENTAKNGGMVYTKDATVRIKGGTLKGNTATTGGVGYGIGGHIILEDIEPQNNSAKSGGVLCTEDGKLTLTNVTATENTATGSGGVIHAHNGEIALTKSTIQKNSATTNGGALYLEMGTATLSETTFDQNTAGNHGGAIDLAGTIATTDETCTFTNNHADNHGGAVYVVYFTEVAENEGETDVTHRSNLTANGTLFQGNTALGGGAISVRTGCEATLNETNLTQNSASGFAGEDDGDGEGGGAIYVGFGTVNLNKVTATQNTASGFGGAVDAVAATVNVTDGTFSENTAGAGGAFYAQNTSDLTFNGTALKNNQSTFDNKSAETTDSGKGGGAVAIHSGTLSLTDATLLGNSSNYYGGAILGSGTTVTIKGGSMEGSSGVTGSGAYFRGNAAVTMENLSIANNSAERNSIVYTGSGTLEMNNVTASNNQAPYGGVLQVAGTGTRATLKDCAWSQNSATYGGALYTNSSAVTVENCEMNLNSSQLGGAIYSTAGTLEVKDSTFAQNSATKDGNGYNGNGGAITIVGAEATLTGNNQLYSNTAENHGGAIYVAYIKNADETRTPGVLNMTDGVLRENEADAGGAISARTDSVVTLTGTELSENTARGETKELSGGALYANTNTITLSGVEMRKNKTGYYGGAISASDVELTIKDESLITENTGTTGATLYFINGTEATIENSQLLNNISTSNGNVYINGGSLDMKEVTATGNRAYNGGVLYTSGSTAITITDCIIEQNTATNFGGAIHYSGTKTLEIATTSLKDNTASKTGGAIYHSGTGTVTLDGSTLERNSAKLGGSLHTEAGKTVIKNTAFTQNTATDKGGAISAAMAANVEISEQSTFTQNTALSAGALLADTGAKVAASNSTFDGNSATNGIGGAVVLADSGTEGTAETTLNLTKVTLQNNTASGRGGAFSTDENSVNLVLNATECNFIKNTSTGAGAGAAEIQNANCASATPPTKVTLEFNNCTFTENTAKATGGAMEVRTSSCAKFNGLTMNGNKATANGGGIYVTSEYSRVYLTGTVTGSNNMSSQSGDSIFHLYNSGYNVPPMIYTTDSSDAAWCSQVSGNTTSVTFNLPTLP